MLDARIKAIATELNDARDMRERASRELAEVLFRDKNAEREVTQIIEQAKEEAKELQLEARLERAEHVKRVRAFAQERLAEVEVRWRARVRSSFVSMVLAASEEVLRRSLSERKVQTLLLERALRNLPRDAFAERRGIAKV